MQIWWTMKMPFIVAEFASAIISFFCSVKRSNLIDLIFYLYTSVSMQQKMIQGTAIYDEIKITSKGNLKQTTLPKIGKKMKSIIHRLHICNLNK